MWYILHTQRVHAHYTNKFICDDDHHPAGCNIQNAHAHTHTRACARMQQMYMMLTLPSAAAAAAQSTEAREC